ncbi:unnamed protein product [Enterobius vermicularis]|uniref:Battenin n=1 Tax=Enterobius vermicularis TaxID=51028 RepID=A0A158Q942_ENTVE|nr:unnamed protein product [Enterobius vermicularis]
MLSAAQDILDEQEDNDESSDKTDNNCAGNFTERPCSKVSTGAVLLADILPTLLVKMTFPLFMQRIPFGARHVFICFMQAASFLIVAFSASISMSLIGVVVASIGCGIGEITYLSLTPYFGRNTISTWSSGTGGAGVIGALAYAGLTDEHLGNLSPKTTLLVMLIIPAIFFVSYYLLLEFPSTVYQAKLLKPRSWIVPSNKISPTTPDLSNLENSEKAVNEFIKVQLQKTELDGYASIGETSTEVTAVDDSVAVKQRHLCMKEKFLLILPLLKYMIPLMTVYIGEYLINQGIVQLIFFNCSHGWHLSLSSQYRWYQVLYQAGVFVSRSSINVIRLPYFIMVLLPILQILNAVLFFLDSLYFFIPHIWILFLLIIFEGLFGGSSYVNTFDHIHKKVGVFIHRFSGQQDSRDYRGGEGLRLFIRVMNLVVKCLFEGHVRVAPDVREYSMSVGSLGDSIGIVIAGFLSIPLHNYVCGTKLPKPERFSSA